MVSPAPRDPDSAWLATLTVLYVEDDADVREQLCRFLRRRVGRVIEATDGVEGLERFVAERPAMVVTDIRMPRMDGLALAGELRRLDPDVPIIVTTAFEQVDYLERSIDAGVDRYVAKPVEAEKLDAALLACARRLRGEALLEADRQRALRRVEVHAREALGLLAGGMAHDFNNLLQTVLASLDLAVRLAPHGTELYALLDASLEACRGAVELGRRLRTLSDGWPAHLRPAPLAPIVRAALAGALTGASTTLELQLPDDLPPVALDAEVLGRAIGHLAQNAREAMGDAGALTVAARVRDVAAAAPGGPPPGRYVELTVRDTGPGMTPEILARIFDPYFSTKPRGAARGMGLGLALSQAIVHKHAGEISAASTPGEGATFTILLPAAPGAP